MQGLYMSLFDKYARSVFNQGRLRLILPTGQELNYGSEDTIAAPVPKGERAERILFGFGSVLGTATHHS